MKKAYCALSFFLILAGTHASAQIFRVNMDSGSFTLKNSNDSTILTGGVASTVGDGDVVQFGYYTSGNVWVPLTGNSGDNSDFATTSIGDNPDGVGAGNTNGTFAFASSGSTPGDTYLTFTTGSSTTGNDLPTVGTVMDIRFYNGTSVATSTYYGQATDSTWLWVAPLSPTDSMSFSMDDPGVTWLNNHVGFTGTLLAPEPEGAPLLAIGLAFLAYFHFRRRRVCTLQ